MANRRPRVARPGVGTRLLADAMAAVLAENPVGALTVRPLVVDLIGRGPGSLLLRLHLRHLLLLLLLRLFLLHALLRELLLLRILLRPLRTIEQAFGAREPRPLVQ